MTIFTKNKKKFITVLYIFAVILNIYIAFNHHGISDEHFYVAEAYRFAIGDQFIVNDWHIAQLMGFVTMPLVWVYQLIFKSSEGIILYFRICYILLSVYTVTLMNYTFKRYTTNITFISLIYLIFVPFNIMSLSYNTISINFLMIASCFFIQDKKFCNFLSGTFFSFAVLCTPYLAIVYLCVFIFWIYISIKQKNSILSLKYLYSFFGILLIFIVFLIRIWPSDFNIFFSNLIYVLKDPSHSGSVVNSILRVCYQSFSSLGILGVLCGLVAFSNIHFKSDKFVVYTIILSLITTMYYTFVCKVNINIGGYSVINILLVFVGISCVYKIKNKTLLSIFLVFLVHAALIALTSNVGVRSFANVLINAGVISLIFLDNIHLKKYNIVLWTILIYIILIIYCRINYYYIEPNDYDFRVNNGPLKYLATDENYLERYILLDEDFKYLNSLNEDIYLLTSESWAILDFNQSNVINYSLYEYMYEKQDAIEFMNQFLLVNNFTNFYLYVSDNKFGLTGDDLSNSYIVDFVEKLNCGSLYKVKLNYGN